MFSSFITRSPRDATRIVSVTSRSHWDQMQRALPVFLSLYKPFGKIAAVGSSVLHLAHTVDAYQKLDITRAQSTQIQLFTRMLVATSAVAGTLFAHPMGMCISTAYDLIEQSQELHHHIQEGNYADALQNASRMVSDSLYLLALFSGSMQWTVGALVMQTLLGLNAARQELTKKNYIEAAAHLTILAARSYQIASLIQTATTQQAESADLVAGEGEAEPADLVAGKGEVEFRRQADCAQYKCSDYSNVVRVERSISLKEAFTIAQNDPKIAYFTYLKGGCMVLENDAIDPSQDPFGLVTHQPYRFDKGSVGNGYCRVFHHGDTVFFTNADKMWLGSAPGLADTYTVYRK